LAPQYYDPSTTGVLVAAASPVSITIEGNIISNDVYGVWIAAVTCGSPVTSTGIAFNLFFHVTTPVLKVPAVCSPA